MFDPKRVIYLMAMYSGCRALYNRWRSWGRPSLCAKKLDRAELLIGNREPAVMRVHSRVVSSAKLPSGNAGMIAVYLKSPGISAVTYRLLRLTSHFGTGHIELAFLENEDGLTFYAIRNILRSNIERIGAAAWFRGLKLGRERDEWQVLFSVIGVLERQGIRVAFAPAHECVALAVNKSLLTPDNQTRAVVALEQKYKKVINALCRLQSSREATVEIRSVLHSHFSA
ncbi:MAG: hypothetical protein JNL67_22365 [Planctomycetaceae bacterium]|nr:hypothetical protein [Planctomycetaceae bacterium]